MQGRTSCLFLGQIVWEVGDHDLILGGNAILRRSTLLLLTGSTCLGLLGSFGSFSTLFGVDDFTSGVGKREGLSWFVGGSLSISLLSLMTPVVSKFSLNATNKVALHGLRDLRDHHVHVHDHDHDQSFYAYCPHLR